MTDQLENCLRCHKELAHVNQRDLAGGGLELDSNQRSILEAVLPHFDLFICPNCGLTLLNTRPELKALAMNIVEERGGHG